MSTRASRSSGDDEERAEKATEEQLKVFWLGIGAGPNNPYWSPSGERVAPTAVEVHLVRKHWLGRWMGGWYIRDISLVCLGRSIEH